MYDGKLVAAPEVAAHTLAELGAAGDPLRPGAVYFVDTAGADLSEERSPEHDAGLDPRATGRFAMPNDPSTRNPGHATRVAAEVRRVLARGVAPTDLAVIAAYAAQVRLLRELLADERDAGVEIGTVDGFQGREKEVIVVDLVRSNDLGEIGFLSDVRRMNVALTRARRFLVIVGDSATLGGHPYYAAFVDAMDALGAHGSIWADDI
jgi:superfamily I DNA and/or RNA helicase